MIEVSLDAAQRGALFGAYLLVDNDLAVREMGPFYARRCSPMRIGDLVADHFATVPPTCDLRTEIERASASAGFFQLRCRQQHLLFGGCALRLDNGYLLALNHVPQAAEIAGNTLSIADYSMTDPSVPTLMLLSLHRALLDEAKEHALELSRERERGFALAARVQQVGNYVVHDFNNFSSIIDLNAHRLLNSGALSARDTRLVRIILETTRRSTELVGSLQRVTGPGHEAPTSIAVDEALLTDRAFLNTIVGSKISVRLRLGAGPARILTSRTEFFNCITNLLINARDAMPAGGAITISTRIATAAPRGAPGEPAGEPQPYVAVAITDTGPGMSGETLARAFEPFYSTKQRGSGLGLPSVLDFARAIGGDACVDSQPGTGASVHLYLPMVAGDAGVEQRPGQPAAAVPASAAPPVRILLVDDEPYALEALAEMLGLQGYAVHPTQSSVEAVELARTQSFDLLLTDVVMPELDGLELARQVVALQPGIGVVLMSGYMPPTAQVEPGWQFARKPLARRVLVECFDAAMKARVEA